MQCSGGLQQEEVQPEHKDPAACNYLTEQWMNPLSGGRI
jgi:hypothetical protein